MKRLLLGSDKTEGLMDNLLRELEEYLLLRTLQSVGDQRDSRYLLVVARGRD